MSQQIDQLRDAIHDLHGGEATHHRSVPVIELFDGKTVWDGIVEVFHLKGHSKANKVYAWFHASGDFVFPVTVLHIPPAITPADAVRAFIVQEFKKMSPPKPKKMGRPVLPKGRAKAGRVQIRMNDDELKKVAAKAKANKQTVSEWARSILIAALESQ